MRWPWQQRAPQPAAPEAPRIEPRAALQVSYGAVAAAGAGSAAATPFRLTAPRPGVLPSGAAGMAQDQNIAIAYGYSAGTGGEGLEWLGYQYLTELTQRPEYRRISETIAKEMTRRWIKLHAAGTDDKSEKIARLEAALKRYRVQDMFRRAAEHDGFFGRAQIYLDTGDGDDPEELRAPLIVDAAKIKLGGLKRLATIEPIWTYPNEYDSSDPLRPDYFKPKSWFVQGKTVHASRLLTFVGREVPDLLKPAYMFGGLSMSQMAKPYVDNWLRTRQSVSDLLHSFSTMVLSTNLSATLSGAGGQAMQMRAQLFNLCRDNRGLMMLDKETETLANVSTPLGSLDHLQAQAQEQMASVSGIPLVVLLGITPSGLNASSDGEIRAFYAWIESQQEHLFRANLERLIRIVQLSEFGAIDDGITFTFEPLWRLDSAGAAAVRKTNADTDAVLVEIGAIGPEDVRQRVAQEEDSLYSGLDLSVEAPGPPEGGGEFHGLGDPAERIAGSGAASSGSGANASDAAWNESDHSRRDDGKFGSGGGGKAPKAAQSATSKDRGSLVGTATRDGKRVMGDGSALPPHIAALKLPPAWTNVQVNPNPGGALLAIGKDKKGRPQSVYSEEFKATQAAAKFARIDALMKQYPAIVEQNARGQASQNPKVKDAADCLDLIMKMGVRPGSDDDTGADKKAYGATTLQGRHVNIAPEGTSLTFTGKKGVSLSLRVDDGPLAENLADRARSAGADGALFPNLSDQSLRDYTHTLGDGSFKVKDFRTRLATDVAGAMVAGMASPKTEKAFKAATLEVSRAVAKKLGNTPAIALQSYINPTVFSAWKVDK